ncbi:hypothetical protein QS306_12425 [Paraburkholderia bonniea]|uniref:hypothetical protein n=1 Tax=Paraburkholderia bonniea TaxID=2152891 RepID=UPI0012925024|nr:hypothetical protein [Paraburkholderia bonniea]WJF89898.1 hypothetical protein QS306_12425 [Paraburkholderia bonniea]WJF93212.1 hypothetical protein QS308_12435 [Paraburkholderia bonniea]
MQSVPGAFMAHQLDRHFANPSMGRANFSRKSCYRCSGSIKRLLALAFDASWIWRAVPEGTARLAVFISVSALHLRAPMNSPLRSTRPEKRLREAGFDEGCS